MLSFGQSLRWSLDKHASSFESITRKFQFADLTVALVTKAWRKLDRHERSSRWCSRAHYTCSESWRGTVLSLAIFLTPISLSFPIIIKIAKWCLNLKKCQFCKSSLSRGCTLLRLTYFVENSTCSGRLRSITASRCILAPVVSVQGTITAGFSQMEDIGERQFETLTPIHIYYVWFKRLNYTVTLYPLPICAHLFRDRLRWWSSSHHSHGESESMPTSLKATSLRGNGAASRSERMLKSSSALDILYANRGREQHLLLSTFPLPPNYSSLIG